MTVKEILRRYFLEDPRNQEWLTAECYWDYPELRRFCLSTVKRALRELAREGLLWKALDTGPYGHHRRIAYCINPDLVPKDC